MAYKPVGVDESSNFPPRVMTRLTAFVENLLAPFSTNVESLEVDKAAANHTHSALYWGKTESHGNYYWKTGDAAPPWVGNRPAGLRAHLTVEDPMVVPSWSNNDDFVYVRAASTLPQIRAVGPFVEATANATSVACAAPATTVVGDSLWYIVGINVAVPLPAGYTKIAELINTGGANALALIKKDALAVSGDIGATTTFSGWATTAAAGVCFAWNGAVAVSGSVATVEQTVDGTTLPLPGITPTVASTILGVSSIRYSTVAGEEDVLDRAGWTEVFNNETKKAGAQNRGLYIATLNAAGAPGVPVVASTAASADSMPIQATSFTLSVVKA